MTNESNDKNPPRPWVAVFIEIVLRAMRRVHYEYGIFGENKRKIIKE